MNVMQNEKCDQKKIKKSTVEYVNTIQGLGILCIKISFLPSFLHNKILTSRVTIVIYFLVS